MLNNIKFITILLVLLTINSCNCFYPKLVNVSYGTTNRFILNDTIEYILQYSPNQKSRPGPTRITISSEDAETAAPILIVARQPKELVSFTLPLLLEYKNGVKVFNRTSRTLCRRVMDNHIVMESHEDNSSNYFNPIITVSTAAKLNTSVDIKVDYETDFHIHPSIEYNFTISPSEPKYYFYNFSTDVTKNQNSNYDTVILEVYSNDSICMTVSIQNMSCPVFDMNQDITFRGFYETVNTKGGITIPKYKFPYGFYVVFVAKIDNSDCGDMNISQKNQEKHITLIIKPSISYQDYVFAVAITLSCIIAFYVIFGLGIFCYSRRNLLPREMDYVPTSSNSGSVQTTPHNDDTISVDETDYDTIVETESDRHLRLGRQTLYLSDLARKDPRILKYRSYLYLYNILTVSLFYGLPVVQLVVTYQRVLNQTGEQDLCYYNFLCAHPLGVLSDFNHLFSNVGYILFGILFLWIVYRREITHKDLDFDRYYGIPQHYGMFYAMGVALIMEGVLSGSYHVCPNQSNFQFDSSFMYVMAVLCMVKLYQNRHPDINATSYATFGVLAVAILLGMIGILEGNLVFWILFTILYLIVCLYLSAQIYYMGCWKLDKGIFIRVYQQYTYDYHSGWLNVLKPVHTARMCLLVIGNLCNWGLAGVGVYRHQTDFAIYLLAIFMANTLLYFFFYIIMKYRHREGVSKLSLFFLLLSILCAVSAMYFFLHKSISWSKTPAQSRQFNQECKLLRFYDYHDIWHFLSAIGMFFTFMVLLTLDDNISHKHRTEIIVF